MEMSLFKKDGEVWTRFKVSVKQFRNWKTILEIKYSVDTRKPVKESSRYIYFEQKGDFLNG